MSGNQLRPITALPALPSSFTTLKFEFYIVDGIGWPVLASLLFLAYELLPEYIVVALCANFVHNNLFLIVRNLVDDVLWTATSQFQFIESADAVGVDRKTESWLVLGAHYRVSVLAAPEVLP